jgi:hypothetical protein
VVHIEVVLVAQLDDRALVAPAGLGAISDAITRAELIMPLSASFFCRIEAIGP